MRIGNWIIHPGWCVILALTAIANVVQSTLERVLPVSCGRRGDKGLRPSPCSREHT